MTRQVKHDFLISNAQDLRLTNTVLLVRHARTVKVWSCRCPSANTRKWTGVRLAGTPPSNCVTFTEAAVACMFEVQVTGSAASVLALLVACSPMAHMIHHTVLEQRAAAAARAAISCSRTAAHKQPTQPSKTSAHINSRAEQHALPCTRAT